MLHTPDDAATIELRESALDWRDYLDGKAVHNGDRLEWWDGTSWQLVRYETEGRAKAYLVGDDAAGIPHPLDRATMRFRWPITDVGPRYVPDNT